MLETVSLAQVISIEGFNLKRRDPFGVGVHVVGEGGLLELSHRIIMRRG